jgi:hypothetical protein
MAPSNSDLATWASLLGAIATVLGLLQSATLLVAVGAFAVGVSIFALAKAGSGRKVLRSAAINIEGLNLDTLNLANLRRRLNKSLVVHRAYHLARIDGQDLTISWQYDGYCGADKETSMEFSVDSENNIPFNELECYAFDLHQDPECLHRIRPILLGSDGLSKKLAIPFLKPLELNQPFSILFNCKLTGCMSSGVQYYTSTLSFDQRSIRKLAVHLIFVDQTPTWVRAYECNSKGQPTLISDLRPLREQEGVTEYIDVAENVDGQSTRIYIFHLPPGPQRNLGLLGIEADT